RVTSSTPTPAPRLRTRAARRRSSARWVRRSARRKARLTHHKERCDMNSISSAIERASNHLTEHPDAARSSDSRATAVREDGLRFRIEGPWGSLTTDMAESVGGGASAPTPAWLMRAALAACDATLVAMEAARDGIELTDLEVSVE